ncbi:MAG: FISUMP domain-containing protein [Bacteroidales bacterium]|nr:FISUMP domain-containing protein [Bacteroidales bacterium]MDD3892587.1 FISUMP domain-containing protein [Bacteroidales bacterium]
MKNKTFFSISILFMGLILVFANSCKKDDPQDPTTFTDSRDGNVYKTVTIGSQVWMAENLRYLPSVVGPSAASDTKPYYYVYGYEGTDVAEAKAKENYKTYGVLYNWSAAMAGAEPSETNPSGVKGVCPTGWHLPSVAEWTELIEFMGGQDKAAAQLKEAGTIHWAGPNAGVTNESGFTALPGGYRLRDGGYAYINDSGYWWGATEYKDNNANAYYWKMNFDSDEVFRYPGGKTIGFSVRCIRDK